MILLIDNYDSFSYNLYQMLGSISSDIRVVRNDDISIPEIRRMDVSHIVLSPGPGRPADSGVCEDVVREFAGKIPILGVCLGHQAICEAFMGNVDHASRLMHGKKSVASIDTSCAVFAGLSDNIEVARYHSLSVSRKDLPDELKIIASANDDNEIMGIKHEEYEVYGLQFHPESILTPDGKKILSNFINI